MGVQLSYGLRSGAIVHVSEVDRGLNCECTCPGCGALLVARKGARREAHFAHFNAVECDLRAATETALHLLTKQILHEVRRIWLPPLQVVATKRDITGIVRSKSAVIGSKTIDLCMVESEVPVGPFRVDVMASANGRQLAIEIRVTHSVHKEKCDYLSDQGVSTIEIDLSGTDRDISVTELRRILTQASNLVTWLFNARAERMRADLQRKLDRSVAAIDDGIRRKQAAAISRQLATREEVQRIEGELHEYLLNRKLPDDDPAYAVADKRAADVRRLLGLGPVPDQPQINVATKDARAFACDAWVWQGWILYKWLLQPTPERAIGKSFRALFVVEWATKYLPIPRCVRFLDYPDNKRLCERPHIVPSPYSAVREYLRALKKHGYLRPDRGDRYHVIGNGLA